VIHDTPEQIIANIAEGERLSIRVGEFTEENQIQLRNRLISRGASLAVEAQSEGVELRIQSKQQVTPQVLQFLFEHGIIPQRLEVEKPKLEDAILKLNRSEVSGRKTG
jgi:ABC-2 type transport system ATP-binding protein